METLLITRSGLICIATALIITALYRKYYPYIQYRRRLRQWQKSRPTTDSKPVLKHKRKAK